MLTTHGISLELESMYVNIKHRQLDSHVQHQPLSVRTF